MSDDQDEGWAKTLRMASEANIAAHEAAKNAEAANRAAREHLERIEGSMTITEFLAARHDEDEAVAQAASPGPWHTNAESDEVLAMDDITVAEGFALSGPQVRATTAHIARHDPARVLADVAAKRAIIEDHGWKYADPYESWKGDAYRERYGDTRDSRLCTRCGGTSPHPNLGEVERRDSWPCTTLRLLALPYAEHEDYDEEWRP